MQEKSNQRLQLRAGLIIRNPDLFDSVKEKIDQIFSLINTYVSRRDYQVVSNGLNAVYFIVVKYIDVRKGTFFPSSLVPELDFSSDRFLNDVFEKFAALHRIATKNRDLELSKDVIECFSKIAIKCVDIEYISNPLGEYTHCMLAVQYMQQSIKESLDTGLSDVGISGSENHKKVGYALIVKKATTNVRLIVEHLFELAMYGITRPQTNYLVSYPLQALGSFIKTILFYEGAYDHILARSILEKAQEIINLYVKIKDTGPSHLNVELEFALGPLLNLSNSGAIPYLFSEATKIINDDKTKKEVKDGIIEQILEFGGDAWRFYDEISKIAGEKQSFLIHFIDSNLHHIILSLLRLYQSDKLNQEQKEQALEVIGWVISDYWRIYDYHKEITSSFESQILNHLLEIGFQLNVLSLSKDLLDLVHIIIAIAKSFLEKQKDSYGFDPIRIIEKAAYLCMLNGLDTLKNEFIKAIKEGFWPKYLEKFPSLKTPLFDELSSIDPVTVRLEGGLDFEDQIIAMLEKEKIDLFVKDLKIGLLGDA